MERTKYDTIQQAQATIDRINAFFGIPVSPDAVTQTYTNYYEEEGFYYIDNLPEYLHLL